MEKRAKNNKCKINIYNLRVLIAVSEQHSASFSQY